MANELVKFTDGELSLAVQVSPEQQTVWLTQKQMGSLFGVKQATISEHINFPIKVPEVVNRGYTTSI